MQYFCLYFCVPYNALYSFALYTLKILILKLFNFWRKAPIQDAIFPFCEELSKTTWCTHCPPSFRLEKRGFPQVIWCPCWVESNRALRRCKPVWTSPLVLWTLWNAISKCPLCSIVINIFLSWNNISGFTFLLIWIRINEQTKVIKLVMQLAPPFIKVLKEIIFYVCLIVLIFYFC